MSGIACAAVVLLAGCASSQFGPLRTSGTVGAGTSANPGSVVVFTVQARNNSDRSVTLRSVRLLRVPRMEAPILVHSAVVAGPDTLENAHGWPPPADGGPGPNGTWPLVALNGYVVPARHVVGIVVGVEGSRPGADYVMGGLVASYSVGGSTASSVLVMVNMVCVDGLGNDPRDPCADQRTQSLNARAISYVQSTFN